MQSIERRLSQLEAAQGQGRAALRVLIVWPDGTIRDCHTGETWADPADVPPAAHTIIFRRRGQHETDDSTATGSVGSRL